MCFRPPSFIPRTVKRGKGNLPPPPPPQSCLPLTVPRPSSILLSKASLTIWGAREREPHHVLQAVGMLRWKKAGLCVPRVHVEEPAYGPRGIGPRSWRGAVCVYVGLEAVLAASVLCVTLPSRGRVPSESDPREPQPKLQRGWGRQQSGPRGLSMGDCWSPVGSCLGN